MKHVIIGAGLLALAACTSAQVTKTVDTTKLYCAKATATGPLVVALATVAGGPVQVAGQTKAYVDAACAVIAAIAVSPPDAPVPTVTIPSVTVPLKS